MNTESFSATISVTQSAEVAFHAIANFRAWWSEEIEGPTDQLNQTFFYHYKDVHLCKIKLVEVVPNQKLVYKVLDNHFSFTKDSTEWKDTQMIFEISKAGDLTKVTLTHQGLTPRHECFNICQESWSNYITQSLYNLITTGKGKPNPKEGDGFNAEIVAKWKLK